MFKMKMSACVHAPVDVVWAHLSQLDRLHLWTDAVHHSFVSSSCAVGVGAERTCELGGARTLHEKVVAWEDGKTFTYESTDAPLMKLARNRWTVQADGPYTRVTSEADLQFRAGVVGWLLGFLLVPLLRVLLPNPLSKFKYWVENGHPFAGKASKLPAPALTC